MLGFKSQWLLRFWGLRVYKTWTLHFKHQNSLICCWVTLTYISPYKIDNLVRFIKQFVSTALRGFEVKEMHRDRCFENYPTCCWTLWVKLHQNIAQSEVILPQISTKLVRRNVVSARVWMRANFLSMLSNFSHERPHSTLNHLFWQLNAIAKRTS